MFVYDVLSDYSLGQPVKSEECPAGYTWRTVYKMVRNSLGKPVTIKVEIGTCKKHKEIHYLVTDCEVINLAGRYV